MVLIRRTLAIAVVLTLLILSGRQDAATALDIARYFHHVQAGATMSLECIHRNDSKVHWYRNNDNVPSKCGSNDPENHNKGWQTQLHCPNMTVEDEGIYACKKDFNHAPSDYWDVSVDSCFCFGPTSNCSQNAKVTMESKEVQLFSESSSPILLTMTYNPQTIIPNYTVFKDDNIAGVSQSKVNGTVYYAVSKQITDLKLKLYGGAFTYELFSIFQKTNIKDEKAPLALMRDGDGKVLVYRETGTYNRNTNLRRISFSKYNWHALTGDSVTEESAREEVVMRILSDLDEIYIRVHYDVNDFITRYAQVDLSTVIFVNDGLDMPSSNGKCFCPAGYTGNYCERCAANYTGNPVKNSSCKLVPEADRLNYTADSANGGDETAPKTNLSSIVQKERRPDRDSFRCSDGKLHLDSKLCDGNSDCHGGYDEICDFGTCKKPYQCRCELTNECIVPKDIKTFELKIGSNANPHIYINPGDSMILKCPVENTTKLVEIDWYRNDVDMSYDCQVITPSDSDRVSELYCPNMTIKDNEGVYSCEHYYENNVHEIADVMVFVKNESIFTIDSCFCLEKPCQNTNMTVSHQEKVQMFSESLAPILITPTEEVKKIIPNFTIYEDKNINTVPQSNVEGTIYYALSEEISEMKIGLFGGWFSYKLSSLDKNNMFTNNEDAPLAAMRGADKVLVHYDTERLNRDSRYKRLSFRHHNWAIIKNDDASAASEEDVLEVLSNLEGIYVKLNYLVDNYTVENNTVDLYTAKFAENGLGIPSSIGKCSCPPESVGEYCERCAENYSGNPMNDTYCYLTTDVVDGSLLTMTGENAYTNSINTSKNQLDSAHSNVDKLKHSTLISTADDDMNYLQETDESTDEFNGNDVYITTLRNGSLSCVSESDEKNRTSGAFNVQPGRPMTLQCPTLNATETIWYRNDGKIPSDCVVTHQAGNSSLFCSNITLLHEGVYSCERYYKSSEAKITRTAVIVGKECSFKQPSCFCFGVATNCEAARVAVDGEGVKMFNTSLSPVSIMVNNGRRTLIDASTTELDTVNEAIYYPLSEKITENKLNLFGGFILYDLSTKSGGIDTENVGSPLALMRGDDKVLLYHQDENYNSSFNRIRVPFSAFNWYMLGEDEKTADAASERDVMTVLSNLDGIYVRLERGVDIGKLTDDFAVLYMINSSDVGTLSYIGTCSCPPGYTGHFCERCAENYSGNPINNIDCYLNTVNDVDGSIPPITVKDDRNNDLTNSGETHPTVANTSENNKDEESTDNSAFSSMENQGKNVNFTESSLNNEIDGDDEPFKCENEKFIKFKKVCNGMHVKSPQNNGLSSNEETGQKNGNFQCVNNDTIPFSKLCDGHYDCDDGIDEMCFSGECDDINECRCRYSDECVQRNQSHFYMHDHKEYTKPYLHIKPKDTMELECPGRMDNLIEVNWYQNDKSVPSKCQSIRPTGSHFVSRLYCPNMTIADEGVYRCEHVQAVDNDSEIYYYTDVVVFVKKESIFERDSCFCFGATTTCQSNNVTEERKEVQLFSESSPRILLTASNHGKTITANYTIFEGEKMDKISISNTDGTVYYALSEEITSLKLDLYGGSFMYFFSEDTTLVDKNSPLAVMRGDDKVLVYYESGKYNKYSQYKRLSFSKHNWHLLHGDRVSEESTSEAEIMKVLSNLKGIYVKTYYDVDDYAVKETVVDLFILKFQPNGVGMPTSIGKCSCPLGYDGIYCERCATTYSGDPIKGISCVPKNIS